MVRSTRKSNGMSNVTQKLAVDFGRGSRPYADPERQRNALIWTFSLHMDYKKRPRLLLKADPNLFLKEKHMDRLPARETDTRFSKYVKAVSRLRVDFPEVAMSSYFDDLTLSEYLLGCPQFGLNFGVVPIFDCETIDRRTTMSGEGP